MKLKVRCISLDLAHNGVRKISPWLRVGEIYSVLSIETSQETGTLYRLIVDKKDPIASVALFPSDLFVKVTDFNPTSWVKIRFDSCLVIAPKSWQSPGFWESFYDGDPVAENLFMLEVNNMIKEES
ncbi:hypothetical protein [Methylobacterium sp. R2-1]|uniref:hypothetical protein n=1 Tax=Methylobacterium sp. R2-1 TaxID=2587064 RepID=UPI001615F0F4|nr:hypothetical protein [Methylobacterium sp. R2-1]MBB2965181.1 hypothetical protein [Methylobacterium sp. R2-1]